MGMYLFGGRLCECNESREVELPNPDPSDFTILSIKMIGIYAIVHIKYHDCINYEGKKILIYENYTETEIRHWREIDPHFCNEEHPSPIARFKPDQKGIDLAILFCHTISLRRMG